MANIGWTNKRAKIKYNFCEGSRKGELTDSSVPVTIDSNTYSAARSDRLRHFGQMITHKNYLACKFIDMAGGILVHDAHTMSYIDFLAQVGLGLVTYYHYNPKLFCQFSYAYMPPIHRRLIKAMIRFVTYLHGEGISMAEFPFDENLLVRDGVLKFWKLNFVDATPESRQHDFVRIRAEIEKWHIGNYQAYLPHDMSDLLDKMITEPRDYRKLRKHIAILSSTKRVAFFKAASDKGSYFCGDDLKRYKASQTMAGLYQYDLNNQYDPTLNWYVFKFSNANQCFE